jgi:hypothetical protein
VVLAAGDEHDRLDVVEPVPGRGDVREDHVGPGLVLPREPDAAVHHQEAAGVFDGGHVPAGLREVAQGRSP